MFPVPQTPCVKLFVFFDRVYAVYLFLLGRRRGAQGEQRAMMVCNCCPRGSKDRHHRHISAEGQGPQGWNQKVPGSSNRDGKGQTISLPFVRTVSRTRALVLALSGSLSLTHTHTHAIMCACHVEAAAGGQEEEVTTVMEQAAQTLQNHSDKGDLFRALICERSP